MRRFRELFTPKERFAGTAAAIFLLLLVGYLTVHIYHLNESSSARADARNQIELIYSEFAEIIGVTNSLAVLYRVSADSDVDSDHLQQYANELLPVSKTVKSIGRFDRVARGDVDTHASLMSERGVYRFKIKSLNPDGTTSPPASREYHDALVSLNPFTPRSARMMGVDISQEKEVDSQLARAIKTNKPVLASHPLGRHQGYDAMLLQPTYVGRYTPFEAEERLLQNDGGYMLGLSFSSFFKGSGNFVVTLTLPNGKTLRNEDNDREATRFLESLFSGYKLSYSPILGGSELHITISAPNGVSLPAIQSAILSVAGCSVLLWSVVLLLMGKRNSDLRRMSAQTSLKEEREIALTTLDALNDSVFTIDREGAISYINPAAAVMLRSSHNTLIGKPLNNSIPFANSESTRTVRSAVTAGLKHGQSTKLCEVELAQSAAATQVDCSFTPFLQEGAGNGGVLVMRDVGKERALNRELQFLATHDTLTGLANRYLFETELDKLVASALEHGHTHAVCYIDIDQFKIVNDTCGHQAGDRLLKQVAGSLSASIRGEDLLARLGGDEFGLLVRNCPANASEAIARRLHEFFQTFVFVSGERRFPVRASIGFVSVDSNYESVSDVLAAADIACYSAKDRGRNELHVFRAGCKETTQRKGEMLLLPKLQNALEVDKFVLFVQPIAEILPNGVDACSKFEILLRLLDDDGTLITPFRLISAAERYDLMKEIDRWVIHNAFKAISDLYKDFGDELPMFSINLSGQSAVDKDLIGYILGKVAQTSVPTQKICFEITETSAIGDLNKALGLLNFLHEMGCKLALDDFGAGQCSFGYLNNLPVDYLKVDGQFVKDVHNNKVHAEMLKFVQKVAGLLDMKTIAEFVEGPEVLDCLRKMNIDYAQGYHIGKPFGMVDIRCYLGDEKAA